MIHLFTWGTPNGIKPLIMLEELEMPYELHPVDIGSGAQKEASFLSANPNGKIPAMVDSDRPGAARIGEIAGLGVFESGAILVYLAEASGRFLPTDPAARAEVLGWTFWQVGGLGPMAGQLHWFEDNEPGGRGAARFEDEVARLLDVMESGLAGRDWLAGDYSIADMMCWAWARSTVQSVGGERPALGAWIDRVKARPAVARARVKARAMGAK